MSDDAVGLSWLVALLAVGQSGMQPGWLEINGIVKFENEQFSQCE